MRGDFKAQLSRAKELIRINGIIHETQLYATLEVGYNKFYMIKKALKLDPEIIYHNGYFSLRSLAPQKTLEESLAAKEAEET
jgi:hypothetical protein